MAAALRRHDELMKASMTNSRGRVFKTIGDAFCCAFATVPEAVAAARQAQLAIANEDWNEVDGIEVRMVIHAGSVEARDGDYFGPALNRAARLLGIGHGGQVLLSSVAADLAIGELPAGMELTDLGRHRLRDLEGAERVFQLHAEGLRPHFPALRSLEEYPNNLPIQLTSFVGREQELAQLRDSISSTRLLALVGTGGVGKSRLALQLGAEMLNRFADGVWLVDLSLVRDLEAVAAEAASALSVRASTTSTSLESIAASIANKHILLIVDGCEHVLSAAAALADALLHACANVSIVVTSRQALDIGGELVYNVDTLPADLALQLFVERATAASSRFSRSSQNESTLAEICARLDGIPLALELAAVKTAVLSPMQLLEKLDERFRILTHTGSNRLPRQQTMRALIDWSFDLLDGQERTLLRRLSVFAGGCTLKAGDDVCCDTDMDEWRLFEILASLVAKSLVVMEPHDDGPRYRLLNTIRDYGREQLAASGEAGQLEAKHARYFASILRDLRPLLEHLEDVQWQNVLRPERDNLRTVFERSLFHGEDIVDGLNALADVEWPELITTPQEAIRWFDAGRKVVDTLDNGIAKARILRHCVRLEWFVGRPNAQVERSALACVEVARLCGDASELSHALSNLASAYRDAARFDEAEVLYEEAFKAPESLSPIARNAVLRNWAICDLQRGDLELARRRFTDVARFERPQSEAHASALVNLAELEFAAGNFDSANVAAKQARAIFDTLRAAPLALVVCNLAAYAMELGRVDEARSHLREALDLLKKSGARWITTALEHHALLAALLGDHKRAAALSGYTDAYYGVHGKSRQRTERHGYERLQGMLQTALPREELERLLSDGAHMSDVQALAYAQAISQEQPTSVVGA